MVSIKWPCIDGRELFRFRYPCPSNNSTWPERRPARLRVVLYLVTAKSITIYFNELNIYCNSQYSVWVVILSYASPATYHALYRGQTSTTLGLKDWAPYARAISVPRNFKALQRPTASCLRGVRRSPCLTLPG